VKSKTHTPSIHILCSLAVNIGVNLLNAELNPICHLLVLSGKGKGKAVPLQAWSGPEGSRKLRFPDFMTTGQVGGKVVSLTHRPPLPPVNTPGIHLF
jgi:hypothetical protein